MEKLIERLVNADSISGYEETVRDVMKNELKDYADEIRVDKVGNLIAKKGKGSPKIMLAAHMDELGMMVKHIEKEGFVRFELVGGWDERIIPGMRVKIHGSKGCVLGVIGLKPPHILEKEEQKSPVKAKDLFIDIGAQSEKEVKKAGISVGDFITRDGGFIKLLGSRICGHGFDNRIGCAVMIEVMKRLKNFKGTVYAVGTVQEEIGLVGIRGSAFGINPDVVLALDTTIAGDTPEIRASEAVTRLGKGPALVIKDALGVINSQVRKWVMETAKKTKIPLQYEVMSGGATDASVVPMIREGIPSGSINVPTRYLHSPVEIADMKDVKNAVKLVMECVKLANRYF